jgi:N utilization substance protein A
MALFEQVTHVGVKDCFLQNERLIFVVKEGDIGKAIGKGGVNIKKIENMVKKKVKIVEHSDDLAKFVANVVAPVKVKEVSVEDDVVVVTPVDSMGRGLLIGRGAVNLRGFEDIVKRFFSIKEIKVV